MNFWIIYENKLYIAGTDVTKTQLIKHIGQSAVLKVLLKLKPFLTVYKN